MAPMTAVPPTFISFLKLKSSPRAKSRKITPMSAQMWMLSTSATDEICFTVGSARMPATM